MPVDLSAFEFVGTAFNVMFVGVALFIAAAVIFIGVLIIHKVRTVGKTGEDPITVRFNSKTRAKGVDTQDGAEDAVEDAERPQK